MRFNSWPSSGVWTQVQQAGYNGVDEQQGTRVAGTLSSAVQGPGSGLPPQSYFNGAAGRVASPPWREDDKDGHFQFDLGENITSRCNHPLLITLVLQSSSSFSSSQMMFVISCV